MQQHEPQSRPRRLHAALALLLAAVIGMPAAVGHTDVTMRFEHLSVADGLAQSSVVAIAQDEAGFMWFAHENGLDRFDGFNFRNYRHERGDSNGLASDFVRDLYRADDGALWIATDGGGVSRWNPDNGTFLTFRHDPDNPGSISSDLVRTILVDGIGAVWIGTRGKGLDRLDPKTGRVTHYAHDPADENSLSNNDVYALALEGNRTLWIGTKNGLNRLDTVSGKVIRYLHEPDAEQSVADTHVRSVLVDSEGTVWIGTTRAGLCRLDARSGKVTHNSHDPENPNSISSNRVESSFEDRSGRLWVGTDKGLNLYDRNSGHFAAFVNDVADPSSISGDSIFSIFEDDGGVLWVGTRTGGLSKWNPRSWSFGHIKPKTTGENAFSNPNITSFTEDGDGNVWVGTFGGGINIMDRETQSVEQFRHDPGNPASLSDDRVMALLKDQRGRIWAGTMTGGLNEIDPAARTVRSFRHDPDNADSLAANGIMSLLEDGHGDIWVGTFGGGVSRYDYEGGVFENHVPDPADDTRLSSGRATTIAEDNTGVIWVGTDGGGLNYYDRDAGRWHQYRHDPDDPNSLSADTIYDLYIDRHNNVFAGTRNGLDLLVPNSPDVGGHRLYSIADDDGLPRTAVYGIQADSKGSLWLSTSNGLIRYNPHGGAVTAFHESQGLQGEEFNFGASYKSPDGTMYFGGANGFNAFKPADLAFNSEPPKVVLTEVSVMNNGLSDAGSVELLESLDLGYTDYVVTFEVAALDFTAPEENTYAYMLEGFDEDWIEAGKQRRITYTNLDGGSYTLRVKAANSDGVWNEQGVTIPMSVAYPPWRTWWAYLLYVSLVALSILSFVRRQQVKLRREHEYSRRLEVEVRKRTQELNERNEDLKAANEKLVEASTTDALTGLRNRRYLFDQIGKDVDLVLRHYRDGSETLKPNGNNDLLFLMVDLDNFKPVNDSCGHEAGDELLLQVRDVLLEACRYSDDVIRWGGDEFLIVARETNRRYAATLAERIRTSLSQRVFPVGNGQVARITSSIGYASFPFIKDRPELLQWEEVLGVADAAMYEAKAKRNAWVGIEGIDWEGTGDELYRAIKTDPGTLAEDEVIRAIESIEEVAESYA